MRAAPAQTAKGKDIKMPARKNNYHTGRVNEEIAKELTEILRSVKDPRVSGSFISILRVDTAQDLRNANVHYSVLGSEEDRAEVKTGLKSALGFIRRELAMRLNLRATPELNFVYDDSIEHGAHIAKLLEDLKVGSDKPEENKD